MPALSSLVGASSCLERWVDTMDGKAGGFGWRGEECQRAKFFFFFFFVTMRRGKIRGRDERERDEFLQEALAKRDVEGSN